MDLPKNWTNNDDAWTRFITDLQSIPKLNRVHFMGGEPMLSRRFEQFVDTMLEHNPNISVSFVTNGSFSLTTRQKEILSKFRNLDFCFSIDGVGPVYEYLRYPLKWDQRLENIQWVFLAIAYSILIIITWRLQERQKLRFLNY